MTTEKLCVGKAVELLPFFTEVKKYKFKDDPDYGKLKQLLRSILLNRNIVPNIKFDWSQFNLTPLTKEAQS
jgi:hypothetical protein